VTEQEKREKVIRGLEHCIADNCDLCPYDENVDCPGFDPTPKTLLADVLALLEAQEPRVMTLEEAKSAYAVEYRSGKMREVGAAILDLDVDPLNAEYGKIYRVWTSRPTDEQREETPWE
jgi:hypothetical protein